MSVVAAIDCGTNSIRLLVAHRVGGKVVDLHREMRVVRLGEGVDATGEFTAAALVRVREALSEYVKIMLAHKVTAVRMVATSATRDAGNRADFFAMANELLGTVVPGAEAEVISGDVEARLSFSGAVGELSPTDGPFLVVDLGGGSTEFVIGDENGVQAAYSANMGCVRLTERVLHTDPPTVAEITSARAFIGDELAKAVAAVPMAQAKTLVGVAGTLTTLAALALKLPEYNPTRIHLSEHSFSDISAVCAELLSKTVAERLTLGPMHEGRADVIGGGSVVTDELLKFVGAQTTITTLVVSEHDILDGIALSIL